LQAGFRRTQQTEADSMTRHHSSKAGIRPNNSFFKALAAATLVSLAATAPYAAQAADLDAIKSKGTIRIAVANEIPYGYMDISGEAKGAGPDVAKHIVKELGIANIEWIPTSFSSLIPGLQANRFDMVAAEMA